MATYILQKDLPDVLKGGEFLLTDDDKNYVCYKSKEWAAAYSKDLVENNPEWFKLKEETKVIVSLTEQVGIGIYDLSYKIVCNPRKISPEKVEAIKDAIEAIVNCKEGRIFITATEFNFNAFKEKI